MPHISLRPLLLALLTLCLPAVASAAPTSEPVSVKVSLWNKGSKDGITLSKDRVQAGPVEFHITNTSTDLMHEFLITPWKASIRNLPYSAKEQQVKEGKLAQLAGVEDMKPGAKAILRLPLKPGSYVVFCDQPRHYKAGMVRRFTVTRAASLVGQAPSGQ